MSKSIASFVGLDAHKDSTAIAAAEAGREAPRFLGTLGAGRGQLLKALKSLGKPETMLVVYEAGPSFLRSESVPFLLKAHTQFAKVVDLAIEDDSPADIPRHHRLRPRLRQVEDRRSPVHQPAAAVGANPLPSPIRPPRCHGRTLALRSLAKATTIFPALDHLQKGENTLCLVILDSLPERIVLNHLHLLV